MWYVANLNCNYCWLVLSWQVHSSSTSCKGTSGHLHIMCSNTMIFDVLKAWLMSPLHCVINWEVFFTLTAVKFAHRDLFGKKLSTVGFLTSNMCTCSILYNNSHNVLHYVHAEHENIENAVLCPFSVYNHPYIANQHGCAKHHTAVRHDCLRLCALRLVFISTSAKMAISWLRPRITFYMKAHVPFMTFASLMKVNIQRN